jgi:hypothetical protein
MRTAIAATKNDRLRRTQSAQDDDRANGGFTSYAAGTEYRTTLNRIGFLYRSSFVARLLKGLAWPVPARLPRGWLAGSPPPW